MVHGVFWRIPRWWGKGEGGGGGSAEHRNLGVVVFARTQPVPPRSGDRTGSVSYRSVEHYSLQVCGALLAAVPADNYKTRANIWRAMKVCQWPVSAWSALQVACNRSKGYYCSLTCAWIFFCIFWTLFFFRLSLAVECNFQANELLLLLLVHTGITVCRYVLYMCVWVPACLYRCMSNSPYLYTCRIDDNIDS